MGNGIRTVSLIAGWNCWCKGNNSIQGKAFCLQLSPGRQAEGSVLVIPFCFPPPGCLLSQTEARSSLRALSSTPRRPPLDHPALCDTHFLHLARQSGFEETINRETGRAKRGIPGCGYRECACAKSAAVGKPLVSFEGRETVFLQPQPVQQSWW